jgi:hypothetical protein
MNAESVEAKNWVECDIFVNREFFCAKAYDINFIFICIAD